MVEPIEVSTAESQKQPETKVVLTEDQRVAFNAVKTRLFEQDCRVFSLLGYAGTGKTWLIGHIVKEFIESFRQKNGVNPVIACAAPTNKAVKVMRESNFLSPSHSTAFLTIHSYLGIKPMVDVDTGVETFSPDPNVEPKVSDLLVIDESSMLSSALTELVLEKMLRTMILFVGDPAQLPPVNEDMSPALRQEDVAVLTQIVRHGGKICETVTALRNALINRAPIPAPIVGVDEGSTNGVFVNRRDEWIANLKAAFASDEFKQNSNFARGIAWTNRAVDYGNKLIHQHLYGADAPTFVVGQTLVANSPVILDHNIIIANTSDEMRITSAELMEPCDYSAGAKFWRLSVELDNRAFKPATSSGMSKATKQQLFEQIRSMSDCAVKVLVVDPADRHLYDKKLQKMKQEAIAASNSVDKGSKWRSYYRERERFADLQHNYWTTAHKAQGSTFNRAFVATTDMFHNKDMAELIRLLYTSYTRASEQLHILVG